MRKLFFIFFGVLLACGFSFATDANLVAHWKLDEANDTNIVSDSMATIIGLAYASLTTTQVDANDRYKITAKAAGTAGNNITFKIVRGSGFAARVNVGDVNIILFANSVTPYTSVAEGKAAFDSNGEANSLATIYWVKDYDGSSALSAAYSATALTGGTDTISSQGILYGEVPLTNYHTTTGQIGNALSFNGTTDYIDTGQAFESVFGSRNFSINLWVAPNEGQPTSDPPGILPFFLGLASTHFEVGIAQETLGGASLGDVTCFFSTWDFMYDEIQAIAVERYVWGSGPQPFTMITMTVSTIDNETTVKMYKNGNLIGQDTAETSEPDFPNYNMHVGCRNESNVPVKFFSGSLDDIRIYNKALTGDEVLVLYNEVVGSETRDYTNRRIRYSYN